MRDFYSRAQGLLGRRRLPEQQASRLIEMVGLGNKRATSLLVKNYLKFPSCRMENISFLKARAIEYKKPCSDPATRVLVALAKKGVLPAREAVIEAHFLYALDIILRWPGADRKLKETFAKRAVNSAINRFDFSFPNKFVTYLQQCILEQKAIYLEELRVVGIPTQGMERIAEYDEIVSRFLRERKRLPEDKEAAKILGMSAPSARRIRRSWEAKKNVSIDYGIEGKRVKELLVSRIPRPDEALELKLTRQMVRTALKEAAKVGGRNRLNEKESFVLWERYLSPEEPTLKQIGRMFKQHLTRARVEQLERSGLEKTRIFLEKRHKKS